MTECHFQHIVVFSDTTPTPFLKLWTRLWFVLGPFRVCITSCSAIPFSWPAVTLLEFCSEHIITGRRYTTDT